MDKAHAISILVPRQQDHVFANAFWSLTFLALSEACIQRGYSASLNVISKDLDPLMKMRILRGQNVDGYILISHVVAEEVIGSLENLNKPMVLMGRDNKNDQLASVDMDNITGAHRAVDHLIQLGHRRIGLISARKDAQESVDRVEGYLKALEENDIMVDKSLMFSGEFSHRSGHQGMQHLLEQRPTGVFCTSDGQAVGALLAIREAGLRVPEDISVVGYDDLPVAGYTTPPLTTIRQPIYDLGHQVCSRLIDMVEDTSVTPSRQLIQPTLIVRKTTGPPAVYRFGA